MLFKNALSYIKTNTYLSGTTPACRRQRLPKVALVQSRQALETKNWRVLDLIHTEVMMNRIGKIAAALALGAATTVASAGYVETTVLGTAGPWNWVDSGQNSTLAYGPTLQDFTAPTRVKLSDIGSGVGSDLFILYKSGLVSNFFGCCGGPWGPSGEDTSTFKDDTPGFDGVLPSFYMPNQWGATVASNFNSDPANSGVTADPDQFGVFLMALVAALTNDAGDVVDAPFAIGAVIPLNFGGPDAVRGFGIGVSFQVSATDATYLNLGINDDTFFNNGGSFQVCVASSQADIDACIRPASNVPEPGTAALLGLGIAGLWRVRRRRI